MQKAFEEENVEDIITSLESGKNPNSVDSGGEPLWHRLFSLESGEERERLLTAFLSAGVNPNSSDADGNRALEKAQDRIDWPSLKLLLENGASGEPAVRPFIGPPRGGWTEIASRLLQSHADPDMKDAFGYTPFHWAVLENSTDILPLFKKSGADITPPMKTAIPYFSPSPEGASKPPGG